MLDGEISKDAGILLFKELHRGCTLSPDLRTIFRRFRVNSGKDIYTTFFKFSGSPLPEDNGRSSNFVLF